MNRRPGPAAAPFAVRAHRPDHRADINPYRDEHAAFGHELLAAEVAPSRKGKWNAEFGREAPRYLELGLGNGSWLAAQTRARPDQDWVGLEIRYKRCVQTAEKLRLHGGGNGRVVRYSWFNLEDLFAPAELSGIYIHHPDPWEAHSKAKHRLINDEFLGVAARLVQAGGELRLKTDFRPHQTALLASVTHVPGWVVRGQSADIRTQGAPWPDDIVTGYQAKFEAQALPVYAAWLTRAD